MGKVLIPEDITDKGKQYLREHGHEVMIGSGSDVASICRDVADCDAILARTTAYPKEVMDAGRKLKVIARHGVGTDNIDIEAANAHGIWVLNAPLSNCNAVAEHTVALLLACANNLVYMDSQAKNGNWAERNRTKSVEVEGKTLGIIGLGRIGQSVAQKAALGLGMKILGYSPHGAKKALPDYIELADSIADIYRRSDFVSLHFPATDETRGSVNRECFALMKPTAFLINCARGDVVNEADLLNALNQKLLAGAALDVLCDEPPKPDNPLLKQEKVIISPHNGALTYEAMDNMGLHAAMGIVDVLSGKRPAWPVNNPEK